MTPASAKTAIVTQVSHPVLAAAAVMLAASGLQVIACDADAACAGRVADSAPSSKPITTFSGNLARKEEAHRLAASSLDRFGRIDVLVNGPALPGGMAPPLLADALLEAGSTALRPWANCVEAVLPALASGGRIVSVVTSAGQYRSGYFVPQSHSKSACPEAMANGAILALTRQLALELGPRGIRVNAAVMGLIEGSAEVEGMSERELRYVMEEISLGRLGTAEEVAGVIAFLASEASNYVTGDAIDVNGGWWMS